jgi:hypothetical protein
LPNRKSFEIDILELFRISKLGFRISNKPNFSKKLGLFVTGGAAGGGAASAG